MLFASMHAFRCFRALVGGRRQEELPAPSRAISCTESEDSLWAMPLYSDVAREGRSLRWTQADPPAGPNQSSLAHAPTKLTDIIQSYLRDEAAARASLESNGTCQSLQSLCDWVAAGLHRQADGIIRKLPQMMNSISMQQAQELQECKTMLSNERINHSATQKDLEQCMATLSRERSMHAADLQEAQQKLEHYKAKLEQQVAKGVDLYKQRDQQSLLNQGLSSKLNNRTAELASLQAEYQQKQRDINRFLITIEELELKVDRLERIGQDLTTYTGANPSHANMAALKAALKELSSMASTAATAIIENRLGLPWFPLIIDTTRLDEQKKRPATWHAGHSHLLLSTVGEVVFGVFRQQHILVEAVKAVGGAGCTDDGLLCCQLKVEKQRAEAWLGLLQYSSAGSMSSTACGTMPAEASSTVQEITSKVMSALSERQHNQKVVTWQFSDQEANSALLPLVQPVVVAAMKAQAIASVMHSRLLQLVVPGWFSSSTATLSEAALAPKTWEGWPGVVVFDPAVMDRGDSAAAAPGVLQPVHITPAAAAVFCQEVGVVQLGNSVKELCGMSGGGAAVVCKVLKKPRMFLAV